MRVKFKTLSAIAMLLFMTDMQRQATASSLNMTVCPTGWHYTVGVDGKASLSSSMEGMDGKNTTIALHLKQGTQVASMISDSTRGKLYIIELPDFESAEMIRMLGGTNLLSVSFTTLDDGGKEKLGNLDIKDTGAKCR